MIKHVPPVSSAKLKGIRKASAIGRPPGAVQRVTSDQEQIAAQRVGAGQQEEPILQSTPADPEGTRDLVNRDGSFAGGMSAGSCLQEQVDHGEYNQEWVNEGD